MIDLTVVVPTYNRRLLLSEAVTSLRRQSYPADRYEILIISDGSTDGTDELFATPLAAPLTRLVRQEKQGFGLSAARNLGMREAQGRLILFLDDDMTAHERLVESHVAAHARFDRQVAVCGRVEPSPALPDTPFCRIVLGDVCRQYDDNHLQARFIGFETALSWQTSYDRAFLMELDGYDETFRSYGWEDIEFSYRVTQQGMRFYYEPAALSYHNDQRQTLAAHADRLRNASRMAPVLFARHPELVDKIPMYDDKSPISWQQDSPRLILKKGLRQVMAAPVVLKMLQSVTPLIEMLPSSTPIQRRWYYTVLGSYVLMGYREGLNTVTE